MIYNVLYKGFSIGMTFRKDEAMSWCNTADHKIRVVRIK